MSLWWLPLATGWRGWDTGVMAQLLIDLDDLRDLRLADRLIQERLELLDPSARTADGSEEHDGVLGHDRAQEIARDLLNRVRAQGTIDFLGAVASFDDEFSLDDVARKMSVDYDVVKARKFRLGRTEAQLRKKFDVELLPGEWRDDRNVYRMDPALRDALRDLLPSQ